MSDETTIAALEARLAELQAIDREYIAKTDAQIEHLGDKWSEWEDRAKAAEAKYEERTAEADTLRRRSEALDAKLAERDGQIAKLEDELAERDGQIAKLEDESDDSHNVLVRLSDLLTQTANALKGPPDELTLHDWSDLPAVAADLKNRTT